MKKQGSADSCYNFVADEKAKTLETGGQQVLTDKQLPLYNEKLDEEFKDRLHESVKKFLSSRHQRLNSSNQ